MILILLGKDWIIGSDESNPVGGLMSAEENPESFGSKWKYWTKDQGWKEDPKLSIAGEK